MFRDKMTGSTGREEVYELPSLGTLLYQGWVYARHELLYLCWALMEVALLTPVALALMPWARYWPPATVALWFLLIILLPFNLNRWLSLAKVPVSRQQAVLLVALVLTIFLSLRTLLYDTSSFFDVSWLGQLYSHFAEAGNPFWGRDLAIFFLVALLWWRGVSLADRRVDIKDVGMRLRVGGLILAPLVIGLGMLPNRPAVFPFVLLFFMAGLVAVALTRAEQVAVERSGQPYPMGARWLLVIFATSLLVVGAAGLAGLILSGRGTTEALAWFRPLWQAIYFLATTLVTTVTYLLLILLAPLEWLLRFFLSLTGTMEIEPLPEPEAEVDNVTDLDQLFQMITQPDAGTLFIINRIILVLIIVAVLLLVYFALSRYFRQRELALASGERALPGTASEGAKGGLRRRILERLGFWQRQRAAASIRRLYKQMCDAAAVRGYPRVPSQTPYEYLNTLSEAWPEGGNETELITNVYVRVRYGELPETREELEEIQNAWQQLQEMKSPE